MTPLVFLAPTGDGAVNTFIANKDTGAIAKVTLRQKEQLCTLRIYENTIALETMFYSDEVRSTRELAVPGDKMEISDRELQMAKSIVDMLTGDFDFSQYQDNYREALMEMIRKKAEGEAIEAPQPVAEKITDLTDAPRVLLRRDPVRRRVEAGKPVELRDRPHHDEAPVGVQVRLAAVLAPTLVGERERVHAELDGRRARRRVQRRVEPRRRDARRRRQRHRDEEPGRRSAHASRVAPTAAA